MRGWPVLVILGACYAPNAVTGVVCSPSAPVCPDGQTCKPAPGGGYACTAGDGITIDAPQPGDARRPDSPPTATPWTLVQSPATVGTSLTVAPTGAGHLMIVAMELPTGGTVNGISDDAGSVYVAAPNGKASSPGGSAGLGVEVWYSANTVAGATTITPDAPGHTAIVAWEVSGIRQSSPVDAVGSLDDQPASTTPYGASVTTSAAGDFVVSVIIVAHSASSIVGTTFKNDHSTTANGWAHLVDDAAPAGTYQAQWNQPNTGTSCAVSVAFFAGP